MGKKLTIILILITFTTCFSFSQQDSNEILITNFLNDLFDETVSPEKVVKTYLMFSTTKNERGISGFDIAIKHIKRTRKEQNKEQGWLMPNYKIASLKERLIVPYQKYQNLDKDKFFNAFEDEFKNDIYVLLNDDKNEILEYFQVKDQKIKSFSLFVKPGQAMFFVYL